MLFLICFVAILTANVARGETSKFRILAPEFVCPKDEDTPIGKPDNTIITLQTAAGSDFGIVWTVRWTPLKSPPQRFTLLLWKTVRELEKKLNRQQPEPYVYVIQNDELLHGVDYVLNISAVEKDGSVSSPKSFHIDNTQGDQKLNFVEGRSDLLSIVLVGAQETYADAEYIVGTIVTTCFPTQDYYFIWTLHSTDTLDVPDLSKTIGSKLVIPPHTLRTGVEYEVTCQVIKQSTGLRITQASLPFQVLLRGLEVYFGVEHLMIPVNQPFAVEANVINHDYYNDAISFTWECTFGTSSCDFLESSENDTLVLSSSLPNVGEYKVKLIVSVKDQTAEAKVCLTAVEQTLPVLQITPIPRALNEGSKVTLVANASNVAPTCTLTWYFATEEFLAGNGTCEDCQHGEALSETLTIFSLEENFLNELADFTNETEWRQVIAEMEAKAGRARFVAECGCSVTFECETKGMVYADVIFVLNESPKAGHVMITPDTGSAMETVFRLSTLAVLDPNGPLKYSFYCRIGEDDTLLLGSFVEHRALETYLPYVEGGIEIWVETCDTLGACSAGKPTTMTLSKGGGATIDMLISDVHGHVKRCEFMQLRYIAGGAIATYKNADQPDFLSKLTESLLAALPPAPVCIEDKPEQYAAFQAWLVAHDVDINALV